MENILTKELLSILFQKDVFAFKIENNNLTINTEHSISIETLAFICKKWAAKNGFELTSTTLLLNGGECVVNYGYIEENEIGYEYFTKKETEIEAIIDATIWVFNQLQLNKDITSYEYQKDYYYQIYHLTEFEFITQAMFTLGGGFEYDREKGIFVDSNVKLIDNLFKAPNTKDIRFETFRYLHPISINYLNKDWLNALKYVIEVFKRDRPKPIAFLGNDEDDALNKAIEYYELKIAELEKKND